MNNSINPFRNTSEDFHKNNRIYHKSKILEVGIPLKGRIDYIDLNSNGKIDRETRYGGFFKPHTFWIEMKEPSLLEDYNKLSAFAQAHDMEVLTQDAMKELASTSSIPTGYYEVKGDRLNYIKYQDVAVKNAGNTEGLAKGLMPFAKDPKWAIDFKTNQFLVYEPKE